MPIRPHSWIIMSAHIHAMNVKRFTSYILLVAYLLASGCSGTATKPTPDPLAGYHFSSLENLNNNKAISSDYQNYINALSPQEQKDSGSTLYFEDGTGQHAIQHEVDIGGRDRWYHILIYDKNNNRIKTVKYYVGRFQD
jgi:hypothetical protein